MYVAGMAIMRPLHWHQLQLRRCRQASKQRNLYAFLKMHPPVDYHLHVYQAAKQRQTHLMIQMPKLIHGWQRLDSKLLLDED